MTAVLYDDRRSRQVSLRFSAPLVNAFPPTRIRRTFKTSSSDPPIQGPFHSPRRCGFEAAASWPDPMDFLPSCSCPWIGADPHSRARRIKTPPGMPIRKALEAPADVGSGHVPRRRPDGTSAACARRRAGARPGPVPPVSLLFFDLSGVTSSGTPGKDIFRRVSPADSPCRGGSRRRAPGFLRRAPRRDEGGRRRKGPKGVQPSPPRRGRRSGGHLRGSGGRGSR